MVLLDQATFIIPFTTTVLNRLLLITFQHLLFTCYFHLLISLGAGTYCKSMFVFLVINRGNPLINR